jgi:hypothetical protein
MSWTGRWMQRADRGRLTALFFAAGLLAACGGSTAPSGEGAASVAGEATTTTSATAPLVGRWMQVHTCDQLVAGLEDAGLEATAPAIVGDFFPGVSADELAAKDDLCSGAKPQRHFHFFDEAGMFGSIDQHGEQVDDGTYVLEGDTLHIGEGTWTLTFSGDRVAFDPVISDAQREEALADPFEWAAAGWIVAVAYPGSTWQRVACKGWC